MYFATVSDGEIIVAPSISENPGDQTEYFVSKLMAELVVEAREMVDVHEKHAQRLSGLHSIHLRASDEFIEGDTVAELLGVLGMLISMFASRLQNASGR